MSQFIVVPDGSVTGAIVWWELSGGIDLEDFREKLAAVGFTEEWLPKAPSIEVAALRALQGRVKTKRQLVRPLRRRGAWDFVEESVTTSEDGDPTLDYEALLRLEVASDASVTITPFTQVGGVLAEELSNAMAFFTRTLVAADVSEWLLMVARRLDAVSLRERGGFYFIPNTSMDLWASVKDCLRVVSDNQLREMPAMRTEEAVEAVLSGLRAEAAAKMAAFETYLAGETSTRGLNALERDLAAVGAKVARYTSALGVSLADLETRQAVIEGAAAAARLSVQV